MEKDKTLDYNPTMDDDYLFSASCQDCTGLIPGVTHDVEEAENYEALYPYLPPVYNVDRPVEVPQDIPKKQETPEVGLPPTIPEMGIPSTISEVGIPSPAPSVRPGTTTPLPPTIY